MYTIEDMQALATRMGGKCQSEEYMGGKTKLNWQCNKGHQWKAVPDTIRTRGAWCPYCAGIRKTMDDMHALAYKRKGKCLSTQYLGMYHKLTWQCHQGHIWTAVPNNIQIGSWCPRCAAIRYTIKDMHQLAAKKDGKCLSHEYVNMQTKLRWQCHKGHEWEAQPSAIRRGSWCPYCKGWYRTIKDIQVLAKKKGGRCLSNEYKGRTMKLLWQCAEGHQWEARPASISSGRWCPTCSRTHIRMKDLRTLARSRGGKCLSKVYENNFTRMRWQCAKDHVWEANSLPIRKGGWCPYCKGRYRTIADMQEFAARKGGRCLSEKYINRYVKLEWQCQRQHTWKASPCNITRGRWCPECYRIKVSNK